MKENYIYAHVIRYKGKREYLYLCEDETIKEGDLVSLSDKDGPAKVVKIEYEPKRLHTNPPSLPKIVGRYISVKDKNDTIDSIGIEKILKDNAIFSILSRNVNLIDRRDEIGLLIESLYKKRMKNSILIGNAGCGKTAIIEQLAKEIYDKYIILELNMTACLAGTKYRGEFEEKLYNAIISIIEFNKKSKSKKVIIFIDEIHTIYDAGAAEGALSAGNILKPFLSSGEITIIGATTPNEFNNTIKNDPALTRRLSPIFISEVSDNTVIKILDDFSDRKLNKNILHYILNESKDITNTSNPDISIEILDRAMARSIVKKIEINEIMINDIVRVMKSSLVNIKKN